MDTSLINLAGPVQLIGMAIAVIMVIIHGARVVGTGSRGFSSIIMEIAGLLIGLWLIVRPNDVLGILLKAVGGVQTPTALH